MNSPDVVIDHVGPRAIVLPGPRANLPPFHCTGCNEPWTPDTAGCPRCHVQVYAHPPAEMYHPGFIPLTNIVLSAAPRDQSELARWAYDYNLHAAIDISNDPDRKGDYGWQPINHSFYRIHHVVGVTVVGLVDHDDGHLAVEPLEETLLHLDNHVQAGPTLLYCVAGLRRAPTVAYAWLRSRMGMSPYEAWHHVLMARPFVRPVPEYIRGIEEWRPTCTHVVRTV